MLALTYNASLDLSNLIDEHVPGAVSKAFENRIVVRTRVDKAPQSIIDTVVEEIEKVSRLPSERMDVCVLPFDASNVEIRVVLPIKNIS